VRKGGREGGRAYLQDESLVLVSEEDLLEEEADGLLPGRELRLGGREGRREGGRDVSGPIEEEERRGKRIDLKACLDRGREGGREGEREGTHLRHVLEG